jgi:cold shock CspA family protein
MGKLTMTAESTYPDIIGFLEPAKNDSELQVLIAEVRREGRRVFGEGFRIRIDGTIMSRGPNRVVLYVPDWDDDQVLQS